MTQPAAEDKKANLLLFAIQLLVAIPAGLFASLSLRWPVEHDLPIMLYEGFLIHDVGLTPYRDFFEMNTPGTMLVYTVVHQITAGETLAIRILDVIILGIISFCTCLALRWHGKKSGILASACFILAYLSTGPNNSFQREYLCVLPLAMSMALVFGGNFTDRPNLSTPFVCGMLGGVALTVKPFMILCWIPLALAAIYFASQSKAAQTNVRSGILKGAISIAFGSLLPIAAMAVWLYKNRALDDFWNMAIHYYPLYVKIDGAGTVGSGSSFYLVQTLLLLFSPFVPGALLGVLWSWKIHDRRLRIQILTFAATIFFAVLYVVASGKFWSYHKVPLYYTLALCAGLTLSQHHWQNYKSMHLKTIIVSAVLLFSIPLININEEFGMWVNGKRYQAKEGRVDAMVAYLRENTSPSDTILPLDVTAGAIHALYEIRKPLYGRFIYDFHFYHHVTSQYIVDLRREMIAQFNNDQPSMVLSCESWRPTGTESATDFAELDAILHDRYEMVWETNGCRILRRKPSN